MADELEVTQLVRCRAQLPIPCVKGGSPSVPCGPRRRSQTRTATFRRPQPCPTAGTLPGVETRLGSDESKRPGLDFRNT
ncbi:hypothetical protein BDP81DRAFT_434135 [Colletotrichum phormii]|uniref:Uncharacterized protein n=1 Tax=Colletotrichum phormii TaxID=359342 RepID=A0AAI9ZKE1_9PEZI|nr:uncharacterized protein BDP81DRAFT_434135 [Colletotrichum phormii]KAK1633613.1 hypothetical protein BDP81DRAFT_434135 [Colletotrichum phormii]